MAISLSSISRTTRNALPPRVVIHGAQKIGKSTFAANAFKPIFLPLEDGLSGLEVDAFNGGSPLRSYDEVDQALVSLYKEPHEYGTVVVDSTDWLEPLIWAHVCRRTAGPASSSRGLRQGLHRSQRRVARLPRQAQHAAHRAPDGRDSDRALGGEALRSRTAKVSTASN